MVAGVDALRRQLTAVLCAAAGLTACGDPPPARAPAHVDRVAPRAAQLARFRDGLAPSARFAGGAATREDLVRGFIAALERRDTAALARKALTRTEFASLYYPTTPEAHPPYDLEPALMWFLIENGSARGLAAALAERGGRPLAYVGHRCDEPPRVQGRNRVWGPCIVLRLQAPGDTIAERLFGPIVERDGTFKFVSYANKL